MAQDTEVVIVGAGPVGLVLAIDLGMRGIRCTLLEKKPEPQFLPKMERCNARTMELFRRMGLADKIRAAGLRSDIPMDVFVVLSMTEKPLVHLPYPSVDKEIETIRGINDGTSPLEPYQLISQYTLEPLLKSVAEQLSTVSVRFGCEFEEYVQDAEGVTVHFRKLDGGTETVRGKYLAGCDGGASPVRKQMGIRLRGEGNLLHLRQALYRCDKLFDMIPIGAGPSHGRHYHVADNQATFLIMQDSTKHWTLHSIVNSDEDMLTQFEKTVGVPVEYEMLACGEWRQNLLLADRYQDGRVFLAGDAVHLVIPTGGLGMNSGMGDAIDLSWKLAATLRGWGGKKLLESYEIERRQIGDRNIGASRYASLGRRKWRGEWRANIKDQTPEGQATRDQLARTAEVEQRKTNEMIGAELGYRYVDSPIIDEIPGGPEHLFRSYAPTTWPGARLPHIWLEPGKPIQDAIPFEGYTILKTAGSHDVSELQTAIEAYGAKVTILDVSKSVARQVYERDLLLLRPDMHVVWRGNQPPANAAEIAATATGH